MEFSQCIFFYIIHFVFLCAMVSLFLEISILITILIIISHFFDQEILKKKKKIRGVLAPIVYGFNDSVIQIMQTHRTHTQKGTRPRNQIRHFLVVRRECQLLPHLLYITFIFKYFKYSHTNFKYPTILHISQCYFLYFSNNLH